MSVVELSRPEQKGVLRPGPEQETNMRLAGLTRKMLALERPGAKTPGVRKTEELHGTRLVEKYKTRYVTVNFERNLDTRKEQEKVTTPFAPDPETYVVDKDRTVSIRLRETPTSIIMTIASDRHEFPDGLMAVEYKRMGVNQDFVMDGGPRRVDESPMPAESALTLLDEAQTLIDLTTLGGIYF